MTHDETYALQQKISVCNDQQAFQQLFKKFFTSLFAFSSSIVKVKEIAEEIVEDVFLKLWINRKNIINISNIRVYLYIAVKNHSLNYINRNCNKKNIELNNLDVVCGELSSNPEDLMIVSEMLLAINKAIHELPPKCRIVYKLVKEDGLQYKDVAEILSISPRTVENHIALALRRIAAALNVELTAAPLTSSSARKKEISKKN